MYKRFILRRSDKDKQRCAIKHDEIYEGLDVLFSQTFSKKISTTSVIDTKFFLDEIADNFLIHDNSFETAKIDIWVDTDLHVTIKVTHDGREFNPLDENSNCVNIKAAAARLSLKPPTQYPYSHLPERFGLSFNLEAEE